MRNYKLTLILLLALGSAFVPELLLAAESLPSGMNLTHHWVGLSALVLFVLAYGMVVAEEFTHLRKSKAVILGAGAMWAMIGWVYAQSGDQHSVENAVKYYMTEFAELFLFLLSAMTYVNAMSERNVFEALRSWLVTRGWGYRRLFWVTGTLAFFLSPLIDNLTTALVMCAVLLAVGKGNKQFISLGCINVVVGANAGGAFSPFGDITTLMVWQKQYVHFWQFFDLFVPAVVNFVIPAAIMHFAVPDGHPDTSGDSVRMKRGAKRMMGLFALTITLAVSFHNFLYLPPFLGMVTGLSLLQIFGYYLRITHKPKPSDNANYGNVGDVTAFDGYQHIARAEWDTLLFFFGVIMAVGGLSYVGHLALVSAYMYGQLGATTANILIGLLSAIVDNIPVMVAVLQMQPHMHLGQWLLVTLTAGVGGSLLSIGSAAGVALMGQARGIYTFFSHLKWSWAVGLGYAASIAVHIWFNGGTFSFGGS